MEVGAEAAYEEFGEEVARLTPPLQHRQAHLFGTALYEKKGSVGFPICGSLFSYGCAHALISAAMQKEGVSVLAKFADACRSTVWPPMCLHGIGHGLVRSIGYEDADVMEAIDLCINTVKDASTPGCIGGAIMEYDGQTLMGDAWAGRTMDGENTFEPCASAPRAAKSACYLWLVSWWYDNYSTSRMKPRGAFKQIGTLCEGLPDKEYTAQCMAGEGEMAASVANYDARGVLALCDASSDDPSSRLYCLAYAANMLLETPDGESDLMMLCDSVRAEDRDRCTYLARQGVSIFD